MRKKKILEKSYRKFLEKGKGELPEEIIITEICKDYGWTYQEFLSQPYWFIEIILIKMKLEGEFIQKRKEI